MCVNILDFLKMYNYPLESYEVLTPAFELLQNNDEFIGVAGRFYADLTINPETLLKMFENIGKENSINAHTVQLLFFIYLSYELEQQYIKGGLEHSVFIDTVEDLKFKTMEYHQIKGVWGTDECRWFYNLFKMRTFAFGRLQYTLGNFFFDEKAVAKRIVKQGDTVVCIHIPSSGKPFDREARMLSYCKAYEFYKRILGEEPVFYCDSWLLYPPNREILGANSNVVSFMDDFKIIDSYEYRDNHILWRIFGKDFDLPAEQLPRNTSMQRKMADWILNGNKLGAGIGCFLYDEVNKKTLK